MHSSPKLSLSKLPCNPQDLELMQTPPLKSSVSIPFHWEEAPGKPRTATSTATPPPLNNKTALRCLNLPPRLLNEPATITNVPSPATVLDGPYFGQSRRRTFSLSFRKGSLEERLKKRSTGGVKGRLSFGSWRWGTFKEDTKVVRDSLGISSLVNDDDCKSEIGRSSFLTFSSKKSVWASIKNLFATRD